MTDILSEYRSLAAAAFVDLSRVRKGHSVPIAYSRFAEHKAALNGVPFPKDEAALARFNAFRALHGATLDGLLPA